MTATIQTLLLLVAMLVIVAIIARRLNTAPSILLVIAGILLALTPGLPRVELAPELVLLGILPPLIYSAGVAMSWREFRFNLRPIALLAFGCVVFTASAVAMMAYWLLAMPLAVGFVLGAIVAPPDVVAPLSIVRQLGVPRRLVVILEGEGLANDATVTATTGKTQLARPARRYRLTGRRRGCVFRLRECDSGRGVGRMSGLPRRLSGRLRPGLRHIRNDDRPATPHGLIGGA